MTCVIFVEPACLHVALAMKQVQLYLKDVCSNPDLASKLRYEDANVMVKDIIPSINMDPRIYTWYGKGHITHCKYGHTDVLMLW